MHIVEKHSGFLPVNSKKEEGSALPLVGIIVLEELSYGEVIEIVLGSLNQIERRRESLKTWLNVKLVETYSTLRNIRREGFALINVEQSGLRYG